MTAPPKEIVNILAVLGITIKTEQDLFGVLIHRDDLLRVDIEQRLAEFVDTLKEKYKSSMLNCLHKNRDDKQKFPAINLVRQILKCNGYKLKPLVFSKGYSKHNGKKLVERNFKIVRLDNYGDLKTKQHIENEIKASKDESLESIESISISTSLPTINSSLHTYSQEQSIIDNKLEDSITKPIVELNF